MSTRPRRSVAAVTLAFACLLLSPVLALAHAELDTATPADKSTVPAPTEIVLTFTEDLDPAASSIVLVDAAGAVVAQGGTVDASDAKTMTLGLPDLTPGPYTIRWTSKSAVDGDIARGTTTFTVPVNEQPTALPPTASPSVTSGPTDASVAPSIAASAEPSPEPTAAPTAAPSPSGGAATTTSATDTLIPIIVVLVVIVGLGAWLLRNRSRRAA